MLSFSGTYWLSACCMTHIQQSMALFLCPSVIKRSIVPMAACSSPTPSLEDMAEEIHALSPISKPSIDG